MNVSATRLPIKHSWLIKLYADAWALVHIGRRPYNHPANSQRLRVSRTANRRVTGDQTVGRVDAQVNCLMCNGVGVWRAGLVEKTMA
jgi:hypothetical protein